jgi:methylenetetrahydrofolate--tRNA-(uracil-5-)-methyltransferase
LGGEMHSLRPVHVIGGGLAGSEAAWQLARRGVPVVLHEMRPLRSTAAHKTGQFAELVCSNSFRSDDAEGSAIGLLHEEMRRLDSLVMRAADRNKLPAGSALAVDRDGFAAAITAALEAEPLVEIDRSEIAETGRNDTRANWRRRVVILRCPCADRAPRFDRLRRRLVSIAL